MMRIVYKEGNTKKEAFLELAVIHPDTGIVKGISRQNDFFICFLSDVLYLVDDPEEEAI